MAAVTSRLLVTGYCTDADLHDDEQAEAAAATATPRAPPRAGKTSRSKLLGGTTCRTMRAQTTPPGAQARRPRPSESGNGGRETHQGKHIAGGARAPIGFGGRRPNDQAMAPYHGPSDAVAAPNGATKARSEGLLGASAGRKAHAALRGDADKIWGQRKDGGGTGLVVTRRRQPDPRPRGPQETASKRPAGCLRDRQGDLPPCLLG